MLGEPAPISSPPQRVIRVFISSTFRDMQAERDELAKRIFPQLRKLCESRGVTWGEVDLRWGIPDEQKAEGKVLPICLAEIHRCRPYFIGLLGERYGWVPEEVPPALIAQEPWLAELRGHSVTELEILHGVLNNPQMAEHAFFYFRDLAYVQSVPEKDREDFTSENPEGAEKLRNLKEQIRKSGFPVRDGYRNPRVLGRAVRRDLTRVINRLFPQGSQPDPLDREAAEHEAFAQSRARVYIGRQEYCDRLDEHARSDGPPLVVLGESGLGKSALLANWAMRYRAAHPNELLLMHFIGATPASADWAAMVRRILAEFKRRFGIKIDTPDQPDTLRRTFANGLYMAAARERVVLVLDALDQLEDRDRAPDLAWLPPVLPADVRLIVSTLPGRPLDDLKKRGWPTLQVEPLNPEERRQLVVEYLAQHVHSLSPALAQRIASAPQTGNPLYLRALLEELLLWGEHHTLGERIAHYLSAPTAPDLYLKILERYEQDYERERPGLVRDAMSLLLGSRRGLSEAELMDLLGADGQPLPRAYWSPLYLAAEASLVNRSGLLGFFHDHLSRAVENRYLPREQDRQDIREKLARFFAPQATMSRKADEVPWLWWRNRNWERLAHELTDLPMLEQLLRVDETQAFIYWKDIEQNSEFRVILAYADVYREPARNGLYLPALYRLYMATNHPQHALTVARLMEARARENGSMEELAQALKDMWKVYFVMGNLPFALEVIEKREPICRALSDRHQLHVCLAHKGHIYLKLGRCEEALAVCQEQLALAKELGDRDLIDDALGNCGIANRYLGRFSETLVLEEEVERSARATGDQWRLALTLGNQACVLAAVGEYDSALRRLKDQEVLLRRVGDYGMLEDAVGNQAKILRRLGRSGEALAIWRDLESFYRELGLDWGVTFCLSNQAVVHKDLGEFERALELHLQVERHVRSRGKKGELAPCLVNKSVLLFQKMKRLPEALAAAEEAISLWHELGGGPSHLENAVRLHAAIKRAMQ
jgi:tetratricopeptide (TPR) repeat protein